MLVDYLCLVSILIFVLPITLLLFFFFFNDTATTEIYTLSLHDALPIFKNTGLPWEIGLRSTRHIGSRGPPFTPLSPGDRKSTRLNSSHSSISYAVFCLKKKKKPKQQHIHATKKQRDKHTQHLTDSHYPH